MFRRLTNGLNFSVRRRILRAHGGVSASADHHVIGNDNSAYGHFAISKSGLGFSQSRLHPNAVLINHNPQDLLNILALFGSVNFFQEGLVSATPRACLCPQTPTMGRETRARRVL
jgi:hypothetical protein